MTDSATQLLRIVDDLHCARSLLAAAMVMDEVDLNADEVLNALRLHLESIHDDARELHRALAS